jgi:hypothetical protein
MYSPARTLSTLPSNFFRAVFPQARFLNFANGISPTEPLRSLRPARALENRWKPLFIGVFPNLQATFCRIPAARPKCRAGGAGAKTRCAPEMPENAGPGRGSPGAIRPGATPRGADPEAVWGFPAAETTGAAGPRRRRGFAPAGWQATGGAGPPRRPDARRRPCGPRVRMRI